VGRPQADPARRAAGGARLADGLRPGDVEKLFQRKLRKHHGDAKAGLAEATTDPVRRSLDGLADGDIRQSVAGLATIPDRPGPAATTPYQPEARDRYTLSRLHATGGIGRVWLARDRGLGRDVALKELRPERAGHPAVAARFLKEAQLTGQLEHPGVVPIYELGRRPEDQQPFYTMRFVRGRTLAEAAAAYHRRRASGEAGPLELRELLTAFAGVCNAVAYAHSRRVLHRDLKPQNVALGDFGEVIVLDWGLAKVLGEYEDGTAPLQVPTNGETDETVQGQVLGTPAYMAPEQAEWRLDLLGPASDVYGLGAILYEILTGRPPFQGDDATAVLRRVVHEPPARPRSVDKTTPAALEAVCLKALAKKPGDRYGTAKELAAEVQRWLADELVSAYREPLAARAGRWVKRHRLAVTSGAAAALMALVGLAVVLAVQAHSNRELAAANRRLEEANERERQRFDLALEAIGSYHKGVSEDVLLKQEQFKELRDRLLGGAASFYHKLEGLLQDQPDDRSRRALGQAYYQLAELTIKVGSNEEALKVHQQGLAVRRERARDSADPEAGADVARSLLSVGQLQMELGDVASARASLEEALAGASNSRSDKAPDLVAYAHQRIGRVLADTGKREEALAAYGRARAIRQKLADANPADASPAVTNVQFRLASSDHDIGILLGHLGKPEQGLAACGRARDIYQRLADANPSFTDFHSSLANIHQTTGWLLTLMGKPEEALAAYERGRVIRQKLADANPAVTEFRSRLASCHNSVGWLLMQANQPKDALAAFGKARDIQQKLVDANPAVTDFQAELAYSHNNIGRLLAATGQPEEALRAYEKARVIQQKLVDANPTVTDFHRGLAATLSRLGILQQRAGRPAEAVASFRRAVALLEQLPSAGFQELYSLACYQALLAGAAVEGSGLTPDEGRAAADAAMATLGRAVAAGFRMAAHLRADTDLDALRQRDDFQKLLKDLEAKAVKKEAESK
jgi:serine/threonine-protein kinase